MLNAESRIVSSVRPLLQFVFLGAETSHTQSGPLQMVFYSDSSSDRHRKLKTDQLTIEYIWGSVFSLPLGESALKTRCPVMFAFFAEPAPNCTRTTELELFRSLIHMI